MTALIRIQQTGSPIRRRYDQRATLIGLGLNKIGRIASVPDTPASWGMIRKVRHLIRFPDEHLFEGHRLVRPQPIDEAVDIARVRKDLFDPKGIVLHKFGRKEKRKNPDFKLYKDGKLVAYCEVKSPRDDWAFDFPHDLQPGEHLAKVRRDPTAINLADHIGKAAEQFDAVNPDRAVPNILVFVNHARLRGPPDLHMAVAGAPMPDGQPAFLLLDDNHKDNPEKMWRRQKKLWADARRVDLFVWIDAHTGTCQFIRVKDAPRLKEACDLLGLK
jgi:ribosomal protein L30